MRSDETEIISPAQCRAARSLIDMGAAELAMRAGVAASTISDFENAARDTAARIIRKIRQALEQAGVAFTENQGVHLRPPGLIRVIEGEDANHQVHDDIYHTLRKTGGEVLCAGVTEPDESAGERFDLLKAHIARLQEAGITERILLLEGDTNLIAPRAWYRWLPADFFPPGPYQIYGNKIALKDHAADRILLIEDQLFAASQASTFNALWHRVALPVDTGAITS